MSIIRKTSLALGSAIFATALHAAPVSYDFTLNADQIGDELPAFGISALPAGPFTGSFTFDDAGLVAGVFNSVTLTAFTATVGNFSWVLGDASVMFSSIRPGSGGALDAVSIRLLDGSTMFGINFGYISNNSWFAADGRDGGGGCGWWGQAGENMYGACVGGTANAFTVTLAEDPAQVPLPSSLLLAGLGLGVAASARAMARTRRKA